MKLPKLTVKCLSFLLACLLVPAGSLFAADGASASNWFDGVLDGIENFVEGTGFVKAKENLREKHGLQVKPFLKTGLDFTDNAFHAPKSNEKPDTIWKFTPGLQIRHDGDYGAIGGAYEAPFRYHGKYGSQNAQDQAFLVYADLKPTENVYVRASDQFKYEEAIAGSPLTKKIAYVDNNVSALIGRNQGDWAYEGGFQLLDRNFKTTVADMYSSVETKYNGRVKRRLKDGEVYSGGRIGDVHFNKIDTRETIYYEVPIGYEGNLPWFGLFTNSMVGFHYRNQTARGRNDWVNVVTDLLLQKRFNSNRTVISAGFLRRPVESTFSTATIYDEKSWSTSLKHLITQKLRGRIDARVSTNKYHDGINGGARVVVAGTTVVLITPPNMIRRFDQVFDFVAGFDYSLRKWLILHLDYEFSRRNSNISSLDYTDNTLSLRTTIPL
ncbi:MAG: outer membrane beta-barrel protein [Candidatus Omnitrophica bacterium]|nr:outer membrane beta-barrel protein [Candidatus Omnitrophota bacterium]